MKPISLQNKKSLKKKKRMIIEKCFMLVVKDFFFNRKCLSHMTLLSFRTFEHEI